MISLLILSLLIRGLGDRCCCRLLALDDALEDGDVVPLVNDGAGELQFLFEATEKKAFLTDHLIYTIVNEYHAALRIISTYC